MRNPLKTPELDIIKAKIKKIEEYKKILDSENIPTDKQDYALMILNEVRHECEAVEE